MNNTALILIDLLNDFLAPDGKAYMGVKDVLEKTDTVNHLEQLIKVARKSNIPVIYAPHGMNATSFNNWKYVLPRLQAGKDNQVFWEGTKGADFFPLFRPLPQDTIVTRHQTLNAFMGTNLDVTLRQMGIEKVILAGLTSGGCVEGTGRYAVELGYHVTFIRDAVADFGQAAHNAAVEINFPGYGHQSLTVEEFTGLLK